MPRWMLWLGFGFSFPLALLATLFLLAPTDVIIPVYEWSAVAIAVSGWWIVRTCAYRLFTRRRNDR